METTLDRLDGPSMVAKEIGGYMETFEVNAQNGDLVSAIYMTIQNRLKLTAWIRKIDKGIIKKSQ